MSEMFEPSPEQFGVFWDFLMQPDVTDVDYNGSALWITDLKKGKYRAKEAEEKVTENFLDAFTHNIANCVDAQFNNANKVLEADTKELRISIIHDSVAATGTSVCIRRSPCLSTGRRPSLPTFFATWRSLSIFFVTMADKTWPNS